MSNGYNNTAMDTFMERIYTATELNGTTVVELKGIASQYSIPQRHKMRKNELVDSILDYQSSNSNSLRSNAMNNAGNRRSGDYSGMNGTGYTNNGMNGGRRGSGTFGAMNSTTSMNGMNNAGNRRSGDYNATTSMNGTGYNSNGRRGSGDYSGMNATSYNNGMNGRRGSGTYNATSYTNGRRGSGDYSGMNATGGYF